MSTAITSNTKNAIVGATRAIRNVLHHAIGINGWQDAVDAMLALAGVYGLPSGGLAAITSGAKGFREQFAAIKQFGRQIMDPIIIQAGNEAGSDVIEGQTVKDWPRLFRDVNADLLGGTPDYVDDRDVTFAADPAASSKGIFRRLTQDVNGQTIEDGYHNQTKTAKVVRKPARYRSVARIEGISAEVGDTLDYRAGRPRTVEIEATNDANTPQGITNPYLVPDTLTDEADVTTISGWTITLTGTPTVKCETTAANLWRGRTHAIRFTGDNTEAFQIQQTIPASVFNDMYRPWDIGIAIKLESGWEGDGELKLGGKTVLAFDETDLTAGSYIMLFPDLDDENYPVNFDEANADYHLKLTNSKNNTQSVWVAAILPQAMVQHEGVWYSHYSYTSEPELDDTVTWADTCTCTDGMIQDVLSFLYHDVAPGNAHFPTSGATTIADPTYTPEIGITRSGSNVADGGTIALGSVATGAHSVTLVIANTGTGALAVGVPVNNGGAVNATLTGAGLTVPQAVEPGDTLSITVEVTDGGAGAFSLTIRIDNNDASEGTYEITISGTAT